jgi:hypothetical protein
MGRAAKLMGEFDIPQFLNINALVVKQEDGRTPNLSPHRFPYESDSSSVSSDIIKCPLQSML